MSNTIDDEFKFDLDKEIPWGNLRQLWDKSKKIKIKWKTRIKFIFNIDNNIRLADYGARIIGTYKIPYKVPKGFDVEKKDNE